MCREREDRKGPHCVSNCDLVPILVELYGKVAHRLQSFVTECHVSIDLSSSTYKGSCNLQPLSPGGSQPLLEQGTRRQSEDGNTLSQPPHFITNHKQAMYFTLSTFVKTLQWVLCVGMY